MKKILFKISNLILKRDMRFSEEIPLSYFINTLIKRFKMILRGKILKILLKKSGRNFFLGKKVEMLCKKKIEIGNNVSINDYVYIDAMSKEGLKLGNNVSLGMRSILRLSGSLERVGIGLTIGDNTAMGNDCFVGAAGGVKIGSNVAIGQNVRFHSENHDFSDKSRLISEQGVTNKGIIIFDDCWIGSGVVFLDGVTVGKGSVIGANSIVTKDIPEYSIAVGSPAKVIKKRL